MSRKKLKAPTSTIAISKPSQVHDRRASDLPFNARIAVVQVDDPFGIREFAVKSRAEHVRDQNSPGNSIATELRSLGQPKATVIVSLRDDPLRTLWARGNITDLQFEAGLRYRNDIDTSMISGGRAIDPARPAVDGGRLGDPLTESAEAALARLRVADKALGPNGKYCCRCILGDGTTVTDYGRRIGATTKHGLAQAADFLRSCLDILAGEYGLTNKRLAQDVA